MYICTDCQAEFESYKGLQTHCSKTHKIPGAQTYVDYKLNGIWPECKCGCNEKLNFQNGRFGEYIRGHKAKVSGGFYTEEGIKKSTDTRKNQFASGERVQWNKGKKYTEEQYQAILKGAQSEARTEKISKALTGKKKSPEHVEKIRADRKKYWGDQVNRDIQRLRRVHYMEKHLQKKKTKLEKLFEDILNSLGIEYVFQYPVNGYNYDFYITNKNLLIEVDGDWWHCNESAGFTPVYDSQKHTIEHDKIKNQWAIDNGYKLIRFWESDINNNRIDVVEKLIEIMKDETC